MISEHDLDASEKGCLSWVLFAFELVVLGMVALFALSLLFWVVVAVLAGVEVIIR